MAQVPLHSHHVSLGAKFGPFGGWDMPTEYTAGTVAEHLAVRQAVGVFDVSHMGKVTVSGPGAKNALNAIISNDLNRIASGQAQYSMLCNESGGIVDDLIVYLVSDEEVRIIPNASNASIVVDVVNSLVPAGIEVVNNHLTHGIIAVQGPASEQVLAALDLPHDMAYMAFADHTWNGLAMSVCRTGYTGERGFELVAPNDTIIQLWDTALDIGGQFGLLPCGLGARDTLRTEMGYALHGQDISPTISPVQARTSWAVGWSKDSFVGKSALVAERDSGAARSAWGLRALDRGIPRAHMTVRNNQGAVIGETTSGTFSPTLHVGIGLALLSPDVVLGDEVIIDVRGRDLRAEVVKPPFVSSSPQ